MKKFAQNLAVVVAALVVALLIAEPIVRLVLPQNMTTSLHRQTDKGLLHNPGEGSARHEFEHMKATYYFHEPFLRDTHVAPDRENILVLGDSFTFGWLLAAEQTYVHHLQARLDERFPGKYNLMNAAVPGSGTADHAALLEEIALQADPDRIMIFLNFDDVDRAHKSPLFSWNEETKTLQREIVPPSRLKQMLNDTPGYIWLLEHSHLVRLLRACFLAVCDSDANLVVYDDMTGVVIDNSKTKAIFRRIRDWAREHDLPLLVLTTGWPEEPTSPYTHRFLTEAASFFEAEGIDFCDTRPLIQDTIAGDIPKYELHPRDHHPTPAGARLIADAAWSECLEPRLAAE